MSVGRREAIQALWVARDALMKKMFDSGIGVRIGIMASHIETPYKKLYLKLKLPETELAAKETMALPLYPQMTIKEQNYVIKKILEFT